jgi:hypothetical protein
MTGVLSWLGWTSWLKNFTSLLNQVALNFPSQSPYISKIPTPQTPVYSYCVPENPVGKMYQMYAEMNLYKIRNCMNIAGLVRELDPYAAPTDTTTGMSFIGIGGQIVQSGTNNLKPSQYRYDFLLERAKLLVSIAQQMESAMLAAAEKYDAESYAQKLVKQQISLSRANVTLGNSKLKYAQGAVDLANLEKTKVDFQFEHYESLLNEGLLINELAGLLTMYAAASSLAVGVTAAIAVDVANAVRSTIGGTITMHAAQYAVQGLQQNAQIMLQMASNERRRQDWQFAKGLAAYDQAISRQNIKQATTNVEIVTQENRINELQLQNNEDSLQFLQTKFTNAELYNWMSGILQKIYANFLQQASVIAKKAEDQLAFERQEAPSGIIKSDYWSSPVEPGEQQSADRRGLTGSARLTQDICNTPHLLDQRQCKLS